MKSLAVAGIWGSCTLLVMGACLVLMLSLSNQFFRSFWALDVHKSPSSCKSVCLTHVVRYRYKVVIIFKVNQPCIESKEYLIVAIVVYLSKYICNESDF